MLQRLLPLEKQRVLLLLQRQPHSARPYLLEPWVRRVQVYAVFSMPHQLYLQPCHSIASEHVGVKS